MAIYFPLGALILVIGVAAFVRDHEAWIVAFVVPMLALVGYLIAYSRRVLVLGSDSLSILGLGERVHPLSAFKGYRVRTTQGRYGYVRDYRLEGQPGRMSVSLIKQGLLYDYRAADVRALRDWLKARLPDLDAREREQEAAERRQIALSGGRRPFVRSRARSIAKVMNWAVVLYTITAYYAGSRGIIDGAFLRAATIVGVLALPVTIAVKSWSPGSFQFGSLIGGGTPPSIDVALMMGAFFPVAMMWRFCQPLRWSQLWVPAGLASGALIALTMKSALGRRDHVPGTLGFVVIMLILYGGSAVATANAALDFAPPSREMAAIVKREVRAHDCYWTLRFEGRQAFLRKVHVSRPLYDAYDVTAHAPVPVMVTVGHGALGVDWIVSVGS